MKTRTPNHNALVSIIPFFGLTSFVYLGKKFGLMAWGLNIVLTLCLVFAVIMIGGIITGEYGEINVYGVLVFVMPASNLVQFFIVRELTLKKHERELQL